MAAAGFTPFSLTVFRFGVGIDLALAFDNFYRLGVPQRKRVDRSSRPMPAGFTVAVTHSGGRASHFYLDGAAEAAPL